ncbi:MAG: hypothetical protein JXQ93_03015 [Flavobacteriaceae bacterium]
MILTILINYPPYLLLSLFIFSSVLVLLFYNSFEKLKKRESLKINAIYAELELERGISNKLKIVPSELEKMKKETHKKFMGIRVDIINIDFTIGEILK